MINWRALAAEAIGTFVLVLMGSFAILGVYLVSGGSAGQGPDPFITLLVVPFGFGLGLLAAISISGHVSGGHFNPAVTLAALFDGRITWQGAIGYVVAQVVGAFLASLAIVLVSSSEVVAFTVNHAGATAEDPFLSELHAFSVEALLTAIFVAVILSVTTKAAEHAGLIIPLVLTAIHFVGIPISGASVNPARSLAPAAVAGDYTGLWVYLAGPLVGAILGWAVFRVLTPEADDEIEDDEDEDDDEFDDLDDLDDEDDERA